MTQRVALFWPGDYRDLPNQQALPSIESATRQLEGALRKLGREPYRIEGYLTRPHEAIEKLGPVDDPLIGVCVHWFYGPHTTDGVVGKDEPAPPRQQLLGDLAGPRGPPQHRRVPRSRWPGRSPGPGRTPTDWSKDGTFMARLEEWCTTGKIAYPQDELAFDAPVSEKAAALARTVAEAVRARRVLCLMLGDTSMGMINGYFGPRLLNRLGFTEHKVDQAWIIERGEDVPAAADRGRAGASCSDKGVTFH